MRSLKISGLLLAATLVVFTSCKKDDPEPTKSRTELITRAGGWKTTGMTWAGQDIYNSGMIEECSKDDIIKFASAGTFTNIEGANVCSPSGAGSGTWKFIDNDSKIIVDGDTTNVAELSATTMKLSMSGDLGGTPQSIVITFSGQ